MQTKVNRDDRFSNPLTLLNAFQNCPHEHFAITDEEKNLFDDIENEIW